MSPLIQCYSSNPTGINLLITGMFFFFEPVSIVSSFYYTSVSFFFGKMFDPCLGEEYCESFLVGTAMKLQSEGRRS